MVFVDKTGRGDARPGRVGSQFLHLRFAEPAVNGLKFVVLVFAHLHRIDTARTNRKRKSDQFLKSWA